MTNFFGITRTQLYYVGLALMLIALPVSKFLMSVAQFWLVAVWLFDKDILNKWRRFFRNPTAMLLVSFFMLWVVGLLWTTDFDYALKDLRTKLPLLALPVIISTSPRVSRSLFYWLMVIFIATNIVGTLFSMHELLTKEIVEIRKISLFMSHIRFSLNICVAIFAGLYLVFGTLFFKLWARIIIFASVVWLAIFLVILESVTGIVILLITLAVLALIFVFTSRSRLLKYSILTALLAAVLVLFFYIRALYQEYIPDEPFLHPGLEQTTKLGNPYHHDSTLKGAENGYWVGQYIQMTELRSGWQERSSIPFDSLDAGGNWVRFTLIRYLTSKGLRKDAEGVAALTDADIRYIEKGYATVYQPVETSFTNRMRTIIWEVMLYKYSGYLSGHSVAQRSEFWRAGFHIIRNNFWLGTGTGDIRQAFQTAYDELNSQLETQYRWRTHNQYFSVLATLGIFGLLWFLFALICPGKLDGMYGDYFYLIFFCILTLSMLSEDTIENQAGATFFAFFMSFLLLARSHKDHFFKLRS
jgi:hypothetical protein